MDGEMVNLSAVTEDNDSETATTPSGRRYIVMVECDSISDDMRSTIESTAPDKMISRRGTKFAIGTFTERSEADMLLSTLTDKYPDVVITIDVIGL